MARLKVTDKKGLGHLVLMAARNAEVKMKLIQDPKSMLMQFLEAVPEGHVIKVVSEDDNLTFVVLPARSDVPETTEEKEEILREEARQYDETKKRVEESKQEGGQAGDKVIPPAVVDETFNLMVGHSALSPSSRARPRPRHRPRMARG